MSWCSATRSSRSKPRPFRSIHRWARRNWSRGSRSCIVPVASLPGIKPLSHLASLNGGPELELFRYARHGERVSLKLSYADITEKESSKGPMVLVVRQYEFRTDGGELLMRARMTTIRR